MDDAVKNGLGKKTVFFCLALLTLLNLGLHLYRLGYPARPVFDEVHFATYAADYLKPQVYFDIHPPLGKIVYAAVLAASGNPSAASADFVILNKDGFRLNGADQAYGGFPYELLRTVSALFGLLIPLCLFWFLRNIGVGDKGALLAALFAVLDTALLLETRLILLDGMYLALGLASLAIYFSPKRGWLPAGILFGLALSVKLVTIGFIGPVIAAVLLSRNKKEELKSAFKFFSLAIAILIFFYAANFLIFSTGEHIAMLRSIFADTGFLASAYRNLGQWALASLVFVSELAMSIHGYVLGGVANSAASRWFRWPLGGGEMLYFENGNSSLRLILNPALAVLSALAVLYLLFSVFGYLKKYFFERDVDAKVPLILLAGYAFALFPYVTVVSRPAFLYHYFPAFLFGLGALAWWLGKEKRGWAVWAAVIVLVIAGFAVNAHCVYGFSCQA